MTVHRAPEAFLSPVKSGTSGEAELQLMIALSLNHYEWFVHLEKWPERPGRRDTVGNYL